MKVKVLVTQWWPTLCNPMDWGPPGSSAHGILQARILDWVAISVSREYSQPRDQTPISCVSCIGRRILYHFSHQWSPQTESVPGGGRNQTPGLIHAKHVLYQWATLPSCPLTFFAVLGGLLSSQAGFPPGWDYFNLTLISKIQGNILTLVVLPLTRILRVQNQCSHIWGCWGLNLLLN